jgi:acetylornithine deacetylase/succinyl-diaminopimelate desuccinylase-like protein
VTVRRTALILVALFLLSSSFHCRRGEADPRDPLAREAEEALVAFLRIDTSNPPGNETAGAVFLRDQLTRAGIAARLLGDDPKRQGVYARLAANPKTSAKALLLLSHIDVVPADPTAWTQPPFGGVRANGYIWGRGALDVKSLTIAELFALIDLKRRGAKLKRDVVFLAVPDEEAGGVVGAKLFLETYPELFADVGGVINEGGANETAVDQVLFWGIEVHQKVPLWLRVTAEASGGHGAGPPEGGGAPSKLVRALAAIDALETPYRLTPSVARSVAAMAAVRPGFKGNRLRIVKEPLDVERIKREVPPGIQNLLHDTIAITTLRAGYAVNAVPTKAVAEIDIRLLPDSDTAPMLRRITDAVGKEATVEVIHAGKPSPESPAEGELYDTIAAAMRASAPGSSVSPILTAGASDSRWFRARGIPAYGVLPFKINYYDTDSIHGVDERIRARFFEDGVLVMRRIVRDFCETK